MTAGTVPRAVVVTRPTDYELLLAQHATREQARFFLETRGQSIDDVERRHSRFEAALHEVQRAIPVKWRNSRVGRDDLSRFLFEPEDLVIVVGQDGLVANASKYLSGQPVIGINPMPEYYDGVLVQHPAKHALDLIHSVADGGASTEERTMVEARLDDGQRLLALNELFLGHASHQSARYRLQCGKREERQSSSGIIVSTGTGATGWARSIHRERAHAIALPVPHDPTLAFFVREAFPSIVTGTDVTEGLLHGDEALDVVSEMNSGGVIFGDGIEDDRLDFHWGRRATVRIADVRLKLVR